MIIEALMYMIKVKVSTYSIFSISFHSHLYRLCIFTFLRHRRYYHFSLHIGVHDFFCFSPFGILQMKAQSRAGLEEEQELELGQARTRGKPAERFFDKKIAGLS